MKKLTLLLSLAALTVMGFSCAKKDGNNNPTYQITSYGCTDQNGTLVDSTYCGYQYNINGQCVHISTQQPAPSNYCNSGGIGGNGMYSCMQTNGTIAPNQYCSNGYAGYICVETMSQRQVQPYLCQQNVIGGGGTLPGVQQQCYGPYRWPVDNQIYQCGVQVNCGGNMMVSLQTGQSVQCL